MSNVAQGGTFVAEGGVQQQTDGDGDSIVIVAIGTAFGVLCLVLIGALLLLAIKKSRKTKRRKTESDADLPAKSVVAAVTPLPDNQYSDVPRHSNAAYDSGNVASFDTQYQTMQVGPTDGMQSARYDQSARFDVNDGRYRPAPSVADYSTGHSNQFSQYSPCPTSSDPNYIEVPSKHNQFY